MKPSSRRTFLKHSSAAAAAALITPRLAAQTPVKMKTPLTCNSYPWDMFYRREGRTFGAELATDLAAVAACGVESIEPNLESLEMVDAYADALTGAGLSMVSVYVNSVLHEANTVEASINEVMRIAGRAQERAGTRIVVTNPRPITWGGPENKTNDEIRRQGEALTRLGEQLRANGITLAYHNHDSEFRLGARELHHMLAATDPTAVKFCFDPHWTYRGCDNSELAVFDILNLYADRVVELHLRQSTGGVWDETFAATGDIDYGRLLAGLSAMDIHPLITLEQAVEEGSPHTVDAVAAHKQSVKTVRDMIG